MPAVSAAAIGQRGSEHDKLRQVVFERSQAVMHPRADGREMPVQNAPAGMKFKLRAVVVVRGPHRPDDGQVVHLSAEIWKPIGDLDAALAALLEADLQRIDLWPLPAVGIVGTH